MILAVILLTCFYMGLEWLEKYCICFINTPLDTDGKEENQIYWDKPALPSCTSTYKIIVFWVQESVSSMGFVWFWFVLFFI